MSTEEVEGLLYKHELRNGVTVEEFLWFYSIVG